MYQQSLFVIALLATSLVVSGCVPTIEQTETPTLSTSTATPVLFPTTAPTSTNTPHPIPAEPADVIFHNGIIITIEESLPLAEAIALRNGLIQAVGTSEDIFALQGPETKMIDLQGKTIMPGFVDPHTHILNDAEAHLGLNLDEALDLALKNGITTLADMYVDEGFLEELRSLESAGDLRVRTLVVDDTGAAEIRW